jgi:tRNA (guanine-N7-)-methyltransferase
VSERLFITRKRKKWKFAHFDQWPNCFQASEIQPAFWRDKQPLIVEIAAGSADLSLGLARLQPQRHFAAVDIKSDRLYTGAKIALQENVNNISFVRAQLHDMDHLFVPASIAELWLTFPDPFPRKKQAKHRLTHPAFLRMYARVLAADGMLRFKTDNRELFLWSLEQLVNEGWRLRELSFDLHASDMGEACKITTQYERRFMDEGLPINYVAVSR